MTIGFLLLIILALFIFIIGNYIIIFDYGDNTFFEAFAAFIAFICDIFITIYILYWVIGVAIPWLFAFKIW